MKKSNFTFIIIILISSCVNNSKQVITIFPASPNENEEVLFSFDGKNNDQLTWNFGDGNKSTKAQPFHTYASPGNYLVKLEIDHNGSSKTYSHRIKVRPIQKGKLTDKRDWNVYNTVKIGNQWWMAENLRYIPFEGRYRKYDGIDNYYETYGLLYDWETATKVCPEGWRLPSNQDWDELINYLGGEKVAGEKMMMDTTLWNLQLEKTTNISGFSAIPGGAFHWYGNYGNFGGIKTTAYYWSSKHAGSGSSYAFYYVLDGNQKTFDDRGNHHTESRLNVRCVKSK